jgi:hypothetical protein
MKLPVRLIALGFVAAVLLSAVSFKGASAQSDLTDDQLQRISANCLSIKNTLNQLHASDALLRVNRGQIYESMGTKLMDRFNGRLTSNSLDAVGTIAVTNSYRSALDTFRSDYQLYERQLSAAIKIDCDKQPGAFHNAIEDARTKRNKVHTDVGRLHQYIDDYRSAVNDFLINFERTSGDQ